MTGHARPGVVTVSAGASVVAGLLILALAVSGQSTRAAATTANTLPTSVPSTIVTTTNPTTTTATTTTTVPLKHFNPFTSSAISGFLATRSDDVTAALFDVATGATYLYRPGIREVTASMFKIDILADLLYQHQLSGKALSKQDVTLATSMIEQSDNAAAQTLWEQIGQVPAITSFNHALGFTQSIASWTWGFMDTTPRDQLELLRAIVFPSRVLSTASRSFIEDRMENVVAWERFGIPTGVPSTATVGVKNGWYPEPTTGWQVNSAGYVHLGHTYYLAVVMTAHNVNEAYGIDTVNDVGQLLWHYERAHLNQ